MYPIKNWDNKVTPTSPAPNVPNILNHLLPLNVLLKCLKAISDGALPIIKNFVSEDVLTLLPFTKKLGFAK